jgi:ATP synthase protein I
MIGDPRVSSYNSKALLPATAVEQQQELNDQAREGADEAPFKKWSREEAQALRAKEPPLSPWRVVIVQAAAGLICAAVVLGVTQRSAAAWSALYGAAAVVVPAALFARGMTRNLAGNAGTAIAGFMFWEMVKIGVAVALLVAAPRVVQGLSWPALLVAMIVCLKVNWLALLWRRRG